MSDTIEPTSTPTVEPAHTGNVEADAKADLQNEVAAAKSAAKAELEVAAGAVDKLLLIAVGDEQTLLTEGEAAAIPYALHFVPAPFQGAASAFASLAVSKAEGALNATVETATQHALAVAQAAIANVLAGFEKTIGS